MMVDLTDGLSETRTWMVSAQPPIAVRRPAGLMGIINATPDSFSDGGTLMDDGAAAAAGERMVADGAAWIDVGGESSRPGAGVVSEAEELRRVIPVIRALRARLVRVPISIDTSKGGVARAALDAGATAINDISAGADPLMFPLAAERGCPLILMHMQGRPQTMQRSPQYADVVDEVGSYLAGRLAAAIGQGVAEQSILIDPGIGFGKRTEHNLALCRGLRELEARVSRPLVVGISRKSFIAALSGSTGADVLPASQRDGASHVLHALLAGSCALLRVHDVAGAKAALAVAAALGGGCAAAPAQVPGGGCHAG